MPTLATSPEIPRGNYYIGTNTIRESGILEFHIILQCTFGPAYELFAQAILNDLRFNGDEGFLIVNPKDLAAGYWGFKGNPEEDEPYEADYDVG